MIPLKNTLIFVLVASATDSLLLPPKQSSICNWQFRRNPNDCGSFFVCNFGTSVLQSCPSGLHWNPRINTCDWTKNARCHSSEPRDNQINSNWDIDDHVKDDCSEGTFQSNPTDCGKYYVCNHGTLVEMACSPPLHWNSAVSNCDWPQSANCAADGSTTAGQTSSSTVGPPAPPPDEEIDGTTLVPIPGVGPTSKPTTTTEGPYPPDPTIVGIITGPSTPGPPSPPPVMDSDIPSPPDSDYKVVCYFTGWSWYRPGEGKFGPVNIQPDLCTHYIYAFAVLDTNTWTIRSADLWADIDNNHYDQMTQLRMRGRKVTIALGGWNDSEGQKYSLLLRDPAKVDKLVASVVKFVKDYNFDGIDLDYEYPVCPHGECHPDFEVDRNGFTVLVKRLREALPKGSIISAAVSANKNVIDKAYDVRTLSKYLDWFGVMDYDIHGSWEKQTGHIAPLYHFPGDTLDYLNVNYSINHWISKGAPPSKLVMGVPLYGQSFTLANPSSPEGQNLNAPSKGPGLPGKFSRQQGILSYYEICSAEWTDRVDDPEGRMGPFLINGDQWVSYDDVNFIRKKMAYVKKMGLAGAMAWALDFDDFNNKCGQGRYPLIRAMRDSLHFMKKEKAPRSSYNPFSYLRKYFV